MPVRTTSAGGVVLNEAGLVLVVKQRGDTWSLPKGHRESGEDLLAAARREIYEESGVQDLVYVDTLGSYERLKVGATRYGEPEQKTIHMFLFKAASDSLCPRDKDNPEARWVPKALVPDLLSYEEDRKFFISICGRL